MYRFRRLNVKNRLHLYSANLVFVDLLHVCMLSLRTVFQKTAPDLFFVKWTLFIVVFVVRHHI